VYEAHCPLANLTNYHYLTVLSIIKKQQRDVINADPEIVASFQEMFKEMRDGDLAGGVPCKFEDLTSDGDDDVEDVGDGLVEVIRDFGAEMIVTKPTEDEQDEQDEGIEDKE
jgi:hypothetical protein